MSKLKYRKNAADYVSERALLVKKIPASFRQVLREVEELKLLEQQPTQAEIDAKALICSSPCAEKTKIWFYQADCVTTDVLKVPQGNYKGFTASVNYGMKKYRGDDAPTSMSEVKQLIMNCHYLTNAENYFIFLSCRAEDRELVFSLMKTSVAEAKVCAYIYLSTTRYMNSCYTFYVRL